jgi:DNA (cytosine-5)-methyltransferase 1
VGKAPDLMNGPNPQIRVVCEDAQVPRPFCRSGGISLGLKTAGFSCVGVVEMDDRAAASYRLNFPDHTDEAALVRLGSAEGDARLLKPHHVLRTLARAGVGEGELDLLVAGPPCQGFSRIGRSKLDSLVRQRGAFQHDERNRLHLTVTDLIPVLRPRALCGVLSRGRGHRLGRDRGGRLGWPAMASA